MSRRFVHPLTQQLAKARKEQGLTGEQLGDRAGYPANTISSWENGHYQPTIVRLVDWANALGLDLVLVPRGKKG